jgi:hypothetical protein
MKSTMKTLNKGFTEDGSLQTGQAGSMSGGLDDPAGTAAPAAERLAISSQKFYRKRLAAIFEKMRADFKP